MDVLILVLLELTLLPDTVGNKSDRVRKVLILVLLELTLLPILEFIETYKGVMF